MIKKRIVAEVTKNWPSQDISTVNKLLSQKFEHVIEENRKRGYRLEDWKFSQIQLDQNLMTETIIAVFTEHPQG